MRKNRLANLLTAISASALLLLSACTAGMQLPVTTIEAKGDPSELARRLDNEVRAARQNQVNALSPSFFARAERSLTQAKEGLERQDDSSAILAKLAEARAQLREAQKYAEISRAIFPEVIKARDDARAAGALSFENDYSRAEQSFHDLTKAIEMNDLRYVQRIQERVERQFRDLELRAIKEMMLGDVRNTIDQAVREGARRMAPELLEASSLELKSADDFISQNPYEKEEMFQKAGTALFNAEHLLEQTRLRNRLREMNTTQTALWLEEILSRITTQLAARDMRNEPLETQVANINGTIGSLKSDQQFLGQQVKNLQWEMAECQQKIEERWASELRLTSEKRAVEHQRQAAVQERQAAEQGRQEAEQGRQAAEQERLAAEQERLAAEHRLAVEQRFHRMYTEVQNYFEEDEAEVYRQGYQLVIRMRGIQFPVGKAVIMPENYALLSKVQNAIRTFGEPLVVVEGHTDSTGSAAINDLLSQQRAEAVKEYLLAIQMVPAEKIIAIGFGSSRPLASNENEKGRAINRRIDVILTPTGLNQ
jgi:OmpA-OmpF porin, OOP family